MIDLDGNTAAGILVEQDNNTFLRFEVTTLNQTDRVVAYKVIAGVGTDNVVACDNLTLAAPLFLRVQRVGNAWTLSYSTDGTTFTDCGTFTQALTVNAIGLHADNQASDLTAFKTVSFDYFRVATADAPTPVSTYVYDVNAALPNVLADGTFKYVYGLGLAYAVDADGTVQVDHTDGLGSVRAITDGAGNVVQVYQTDPFGVPTQIEGTASQPYQFTGQQRDGDGLIYLRARVYDPTIGRFLSRDPLAGVANAPQSLNRFSYALNNPTTQVDPSGLKNQAAGPGDCLFRTAFGGFIFSSVFCSFQSQTPSKRHQNEGTGCPDSAPNVRVGEAGGFIIQFRPPSTDNGKASCHVAVEIPIFGDPKDSYINWHIYFGGQEFVGTDTGIWAPSPLQRCAKRLDWFVNCGAKHHNSQTNQPFRTRH